MQLQAVTGGTGANELQPKLLGCMRLGYKMGAVYWQWIQNMQELCQSGPEVQNGLMRLSNLGANPSRDKPLAGLHTKELRIPLFQTSCV